MNDWRPDTAWPIYLSDLDLAKIGLIAQADEQARQGALACLKALRNWNSEAWMKAQRLKFHEVTKKLTTSAREINSELVSLIEALEFSYSHPSEMKTFAENFRTKVLQQFTWEKTAERVLNSVYL